MDAKQEQDKTPEELWAELDAEDNGTPVAEAAPEPQPDHDEPKSAEPEAAKPSADAAKDTKADAGSPDDRLAGLEAQLAQMAQRLRQSEGKIGELNGTIRQQQAAAQVVRDSGGAAPSAREIADAKGSPDKFRKLKDDYPDFAEAIEEYVTSRATPTPAADQQVLADQFAEARRELEIERRKLRVEIRHPDWESEVTTAQFQGWLHRQQPEVRMMADSDEPAAAIRVLDLYRTAYPAKNAHDMNLEAAAALPSGRRPAPRAKPVDEMTEAEYWRYLDAQEAQATKARR